MDFHQVTKFLDIAATTPKSMVAIITGLMAANVPCFLYPTVDLSTANWGKLRRPRRSGPLFLTNLPCILSGVCILRKPFQNPQVPALLRFPMLRQNAVRHKPEPPSGSPPLSPPSLPRSDRGFFVAYDSSRPQNTSNSKPPFTISRRSAMMASNSARSVWSIWPSSAISSRRSTLPSLANRRSRL